MPEPLPGRLKWWVLTAGVGAVPLLLLVVLSSRPGQLMFPYVALLDLVCAVVCLWQARRSPAMLRSRWALVCVHFLLRSGGIGVAALRAWTDWPHAHGTSLVVSWSSTVALVVQLLALTVVGRRVRRRELALDTALTCILGALIFLVTFSTSSAGFSRYYLQASFFMSVFLLLIAVASHVSAATEGERRFTWVVCGYQIARVTLLFSNSLVNNTWLHKPHELPFDLFFGLPALTFLWLAFTSRQRGEAPHRKPEAGILVQNLLPAMVLVGVVCLSLSIDKEHGFLAAVSTLAAVLLFIARTHLGYQTLLTEQRQLMIRTGHLEELASRDPLTGIGNRRWLEQMAATVLAYEDSVCLLLLDTDHFKSVNDELGHKAGDDLLRLIATAMVEETTSLRAAASARVGGDEFVCLLPGSRPETAAAVADRLRERVRKESLSRFGRIATVSIGVAASTDQVALGTLLQRADEALYRAKALGRDAVDVCSVDAALPAGQPSAQRRLRRE